MVAKGQLQEASEAFDRNFRAKTDFKYMKPMRTTFERPETFPYLMKKYALFYGDLLFQLEDLGALRGLTKFYSSSYNDFVLNQDVVVDKYLEYLEIVSRKFWSLSSEEIAAHPRFSRNIDLSFKIGKELFLRDLHIIYTQMPRGPAALVRYNRFHEFLVSTCLSFYPSLPDPPPLTVTVPAGGILPLSSLLFGILISSHFFLSFVRSFFLS